MALEVFWGSGSAPAWRVLLALEIKRVRYESRLLSFSKGEHKSDEILRLNPRHKVPVIRDGDYSLYESLAILSYVDAKYPENPLFGMSPEDRGTIMRSIMEHECYGYPAIVGVTRPFLFGGAEKEGDAIWAAVPKLVDELQSLERQLSGDWLVGSRISAADVFVLPGIMTLQRALSKPDAKAFDFEFAPLSKHFPRIAAWVARMEKLPGYDRVYPPHWRET